MVSVHAGLRALSVGCRQLRWLNLKNLRLITDIGLKHLAHGCVELRHLDISGEPVGRVRPGRRNQWSLRPKAEERIRACVSTPLG
jgi:hypothetical protein